VNRSAYSRRATTALIVSTDALGAALVGVATELSGFRVAYPEDDESVQDAIRRAKPVVVLVDATHPIVSDPASLGPALMTGASVVFYGRAERLRDLRPAASIASASTIAFPDEIDRLPELLTAAAARQARGPRGTRSE